MFGRVLTAGLVLVVAQVFAAGTVKVTVTPERIDACRKLLAQKGMDLPPGAEITGIEITAEDWVCNSCNSHVEGVPANFPKEAAKCDNCGSPMEPNTGELYKKNPEGKLTMREDQIDAALTMGANWTCDYCHTGGNRNKIEGKIVKECENCGAPRADQTDYAGKNTVEGHVKDLYKKTNDELKKELAETTVSQPEIVGTYQKTEVTNNDIRQILIKNKKGAVIGGGLVLAAGMAIFWYLTTQDTPIEGEVTYARWVQTVRVEQFQPVIERGKESDLKGKESEPVMPKNGQGGSPGVKIIGCKDGICEYETYKWMEVDSRVMRGTYDQPIPGNPSWAQFEVPANGRVSTNTRYDVDFNFSLNGESYSTEWRPNTHDEFIQFKPKTKIVIQVDPLRNVQGIKKGEKQ